MLFALSISAFFAGFVVASFRWRSLLLAADIPASNREALRAYLIGMFSNNVLPTGYGGDAVRAWIVARSGKPLARSFVSVIVDRMSALICLLAIGWVAVAVVAAAIPAGIVLLLALATALCGMVVAAGLVIARRRGLGRFLPEPTRPWTNEMAKVIRRYERDRGLWVIVLALGLIYQSVVLVAFWLVAEALGLGVAPWLLAVAVPPVLLASLLPISVAGFGVREGAFVIVLAPFGVSAGDATLLSLLAVLSAAIASLPGGLAIALGRRTAIDEDPGARLARQ